MIDRNIIDILACPTSHRSLRPMPANKLDRLNERIKSGRCNYVDGSKVEEPVEAALVTDNGTLIYRIDKTVDSITSKYGKDVIKRGSLTKSSHELE